MKLPLALLLCLPGLLRAEATVLLNAIPSGGMFAGASPVGLPFRDAETANVKSIEEGLAPLVSQSLPYAAQNGIDYICLLSAPGDDPVNVFIPAAKSSLGLSRKNTAVVMVFYRGGRVSAAPRVFSTATPKKKGSTISEKFTKISVPDGTTTADWIYFNLSRIQGEAAKAGAPVVFLKVEGTGSKSPVIIPGMKEPLMIFNNGTELSATWSMSH